MTINPRTPVLIGVGQITQHWSPVSGDPAPSPQSLRADAAQLALADSGAANAVCSSIERVIVVRTMLDSVPTAPQPFGRCANPPGRLAADLGLSPRDTIYSQVGGDQPQDLVNQSAAAIHNGQARTILLVGAEATATMKAAIKAGQALDWSDSPLASPVVNDGAPLASPAVNDGACASGEAGFTDCGRGPMLLSPYDIANGLGAPTQTYPAFESALAQRLGHDYAAHRQIMSELWAGFSAVAARNPHAQFPIERSVDFLSTPSAENYPLAEPYLKWDVAQDAVNQGAALILTSVGEADRMGIADDNRVYLHGHAQAKDTCPSERPDLSRSLAIELVLAQTLASSGLTNAGELSAIDLYSCFPVAVLLAAEALGIDWRGSGRAGGQAGAAALTVTGGLPFFGGAGNNYSMHAIATIAERMRASPGQFGLVLANGGFLTKQAAGIYSTTAPSDWQPVSSADIQEQCDAQVGPVLLSQDATGIVEAWSVTYAKGEPQRGYAFLRTDDGARILARTAKGEAELLAALAQTHGGTLTGQHLSARHIDGVNILVL